MEGYDDLIIAQLVEHCDSGYNDLLRYIHDYQRDHSTKEYKMRKSQLAKRTLQVHLDTLEKAEIIKRKKGKTGKRKIFALTEKSGHFIFEKILAELAQLKDTLDFYDKKPLFGFFEPEHFEGAPPQTKALKELCNAMHEITNRLDGYLKSVEAKS